MKYKIDIDKLKDKKTIADLLDFSIINLNKPKGLTSFQTAFEIKKILSSNKTGHFGTLDSSVTGVLPIALNQACRLSNFFMKKDKEYIGEMQLHSQISRQELEEAVLSFIGKIRQMPPVRSAVKREIRERTINEFKILKIDGKLVSFSADVQAGTYIRKLVHDIGKKVGGAHMTSLKRIRAGIFNEKESCDIEQVKKAFAEYKAGNEKHIRSILIPAEIITKFMPIVQVKKEFEIKFKNGSPLFKDMLAEEKEFEELRVLKDNELISIFIDDKFIELAKISKKDGRIAMPCFVFN